jgi:tRNA G18 (ribose-2'-O)-methylase SpoU
VPAVFLDTFDQAYQELKAEDYQIYSLNPHTEKTLGEIKLPEKSAFIFGHEQFGEVSDLSIYTDIQKLKIPQFGKVESLNVSIAASVVMYEAVRNLS